MSKPFDPTKPCKTRDGQPVANVRSGFNFAGGETIVAGVGGKSWMYFEDGRYTDAGEHPRDLINTPQERIEFRAAYTRHGQWRLGAMGKNTISGARHVQRQTYMRIIGVEQAGVYKLIFQDDTLVKMERVE